MILRLGPVPRISTGALERGERWFAPSFGVWTVGCVMLAIGLRAVWFAAPLGVDEGGVALVAQAWTDPGDSLYGPYWLDRPPLLLLAFRLALVLGDPGVRLLGALAASVLILATALTTRAVAGDQAGRLAALICACLTSSPVIQAVFTPAELLAAAPSALSVLAAVTTIARPRHARGLLVLAGMLAAAAVLVKQSAGDALVAGVTFAAVAVRRPGSTSFRASWALAYLGGGALVLAALETWEYAAGLGDGAVWQAMAGFRLDGITTLAGSDTTLPDRALHLFWPLVGSGLALILLLAMIGARRLPRGEPATWLLATWLLAAGAGVAGGGSYWPHYLIQLIAPATVLAGVAFATPGRGTRLTLGAFLGLSALGAAIAPWIEPPQRLQESTRRASRFVSEHARRSDTIYVLYARANLIHFSGLRSPYPYHWSLMVRALPDAERQLRDVLASARRPTWVVEWQPACAFGLDADGATRALLRREYRTAGVVDGHRILLRREVLPSARPTGVRPA